MENVKTLGTMLQNIVEEDWKYFNLFDFLTDSTDEDRKIIQDKLVDADSKQYFEYMDTYNFVSEDEVYMATCEYYEKTMDRALYMGELNDMSENADYYIRERWYEFEEE